MAQSNFKVGELVELKSGGPEMTIREIITKEYLFESSPKELEINKVKVDWFVGTDVKSAEFTEPQLESLENE